ncbi:hypothetical protein R69888_03529 [Paraburkholderia haematera]|uniref:Uncharacterized protein n=1 Tax=Paraburkholderia haematera TaxID=2793077 RepID=A0ABM8RP06_9BURK|nr:hypothetical protein R69888_03529 [Paraburkholderia haematera]
MPAATGVRWPVLTSSCITCPCPALYAPPCLNGASCARVGCGKTRRRCRTADLCYSTEAGDAGLYKGRRASQDQLEPAYFSVQVNVRLLPALSAKGRVVQAKFECNCPIGVVDNGLVTPAAMSKLDRAQLSKPVVP